MKKNRIIKALSFLLLLGMFFIPGIKAQAAESGTVYASVEKFTLGQGYLIKPTAVKFKRGETYADIVKRLLTANGYTYSASVGSMGFYLSSIDHADSGVINVPKCIQNMPDDDLPKNKIEMDNPYKKTKGLGEFSYCRYSGWYYFVNNVAPNIGMAGMEAQGGAVVRYRFTLYGVGADLGDTGAEENGGAKALKLPNCDSITKKLAIMSQNPGYKQNPAWVTAYNQAIKVTSNMDSTQAQIQAAENKLPTASQITTWVKAEAARQALIKKNTPARTTLKNVKKLGKNKVCLTWKKVDKATGYEVYQSNKAGSGYKKVKTIAKNKVVTYNTKALKKNKIYYFKIRTYCKVSGKTYYGGFSNIKNIKLK